MEKLKHGEKIVDGIRIQYLCQPCPECKGKLEAAEEMARALQIIAVLPVNSFHYTWSQENIVTSAQAALSSWDKAGKGEGWKS